MFWDKIAFIYDYFEIIYNKKVFEGLGKAVAAYVDSSDYVLECACGTGAITKYVAPQCKKIVVTDYATGMLKQAARKCKGFDNVVLRRANIMDIQCKDNRFDNVIAGNVIHLLDDPAGAMKELQRVCKPGGIILIPTYINNDSKSAGVAAKLLELIGADFKRQFSLESYKQFFANMGYQPVEYKVVEGRMSCAIAVIKNEP